MIGRPFIERIVADLREFSAALLEPGLAPRVAGVQQRGTGSLALLSRTIERLTTLVPHLVEEAAKDNRLSRRFAQRSAPIPRRARASRAPWDYQWHAGRLLPTRWVAYEPLPTPDPDALRYLLYLLALLEEQLEKAASRLEKHLDEAQAARSDASAFARSEKDQIQQMERLIAGCRGALARARRALRSLSAVPLPELRREPRPYPIAPSWRALRDLAPRIVDPAIALPEWLGALLDPGATTTELSFLYQRWCGLRIMLALREAGFRTRHDPTGALFLGELPIELVDDEGVALTLWCEPRFIHGVEHASGLVPVRDREQQPDFVVIAPGERGPDAYVLDATISTDPDRLDSKGAYRGSLMFDSLRLVAGVPVPVHPQRSWALAPIPSDICRLGDEEGRRGVVPLHPEREARALAAWLGDVVARARRWGSAGPVARV